MTPALSRLEQREAEMRPNQRRKPGPWTAGRPAFASEILRRAAAEHLTTPAMILSGSHERNVVAARWQAIRELRADPRGFSLTTIGRWLGGLHHTSVLHALQQTGSDGPRQPDAVEPWDRDAADESGAWAI